MNEKTESLTDKEMKKALEANPTSGVEAEKEENKPVHYNRKARRPINVLMRNQDKKLKKSTNLDFKEWASRIKQNQKNGQELTDRYEKILRKAEEFQLTIKEGKIRARLKSSGMPKKEIEDTIEKWYDHIKLWKEPK